MKAYLDLVTDVLQSGTYKPNRTGVDSIAAFSRQMDIDLTDGFPLLTTKRMSDFRWDSLIYELLWYLSGEEHIRSLREKTGIWDAWADEDGHLDTAYGRFWRRYPIPSTEQQLPGEAWPDDDHRWVTDEGTFDQIQYVLDRLTESPNSRRIVMNAWHPANAAVSQLPPCHYTLVFNVQGDHLHCHLTQRSGDVALGIPFNIAAYSLLTRAIAQRTGFEAGRFSHTIVDAHIYCGQGDRGEWYKSQLSALQSRIEPVSDREEYTEVRDWLENQAPPEPETGYDHVPGLLTQLSRTPLSKPRLDIRDKPLDELEFDDFTLDGYEAHDGLRFEVAE